MSLIVVSPSPSSPPSSPTTSSSLPNIETRSRTSSPCCLHTCSLSSSLSVDLPPHHQVKTSSFDHESEHQHHQTSKTIGVTSHSNIRRVHWNPYLVQLLRTSSPLNNLSILVDRMAKLFYSHGKFCASHPWEVMVIFLSLAICIGTMGPYVLIDQQQQRATPHHSPSISEHSSCHNHKHHQPHQSIIVDKSISEENNSYQPLDNCLNERKTTYNTNGHMHRTSPPVSSSSPSSNPQSSSSSSTVDSTEVLILTISRCMALLYIYHRYRNLYNQSKYLVGIAVLFTMFSSVMFMSGVINFLNGNMAVLNKAIPFFILLSDITKSCSLARFALSSSNREEIQENIARGMASLGPTLTLDTLVETLAIGMGTISGLPRLAEISYLSCLAVIVNYIVFMTFFPAALSLVLELAHDGANTPVWQFSSLAKVLQLETEHMPNPVIQRVKVVMSAGLMLVHMLSRWASVNTDDSVDVLETFKSNSASSHDHGSPSPLSDESLNSFTTGLINAVGIEQILMIGLMFALTIKYFWFENLDYNCRNQATSSASSSQYSAPQPNPSTTTSELQKTFENSELITNTKQEDSETSSNISESCSNTTSTTPSSTRPTTPTTLTSDESDNSTSGHTTKSQQSATENSISNENSDTESVLGQCRHKLSFTSNARNSTLTSVKDICPDDQLASSGHGTDNENDNTQQQVLKTSPPNTAPSFFIGDDSSDCYSSDSNVPEYCDSATQTEPIINEDIINISVQQPAPSNSNQSTNNQQESLDEMAIRDMDTLLELIKQEDGYSKLTDKELELLVAKKKIPAYKLETLLGNPERGVSIRRRVIEKLAGRQGVLNDVPHHGYNYNLVFGACCENVIGYMPVPLGVAGPLILNGRQYFVPMATTEGCLVASTNRGCSAIAAAGGCRAKVYFDGMTRGPLLYFRSAMDAAAAQEWISRTENFLIIKKAFDSTSRFARLQNIKASLAGRYLFLRFVASTGDAMGMNMLSKGTELALEELAKHIHGLELKCLSGNFCTDKKPSAVNWIDGRGKSVVCEARIPKTVVEKVLKIDVNKIAHLGNSKNLIGSSIAGSIGGNNAQAANIVAAIFIATGQDPAQVVGSANCMTLLEVEDNGDLYISCTMPSIEIGTVGGGTVLGPQGGCLQLLGLKNNNTNCVAAPGENSRELAQIVCGTVLAGELSLISALAAGHLVRSHMKHNRSNINIESPSSNTTTTTSPPSTTPLCTLQR